MTDDPIRWLRTLARHYPSLLVSGVCHAAIGEIERLEKMVAEPDPRERTLGRALANACAAKYLERAEMAEAELDRMKAAECTGCFRLPTKDAPTYDRDCGECSRFYADMYATEENEE